MAGAGEKARVVVVGGGPAGSLFAKTMQGHADVVLLDPKEYLEIPYAELRSMVEPSFAERSLIYHKDYLNDATIVTSSAVNITEHAVLTADGQSLPYDYLVIATGHALTSPASRAERIKEFQRDKEKIESSESVLIIGGGPTGVELAAEIVVDYPGKKVTLIHRGPRILEFMGEKASKKCLDWLTSKKVDVLLQQSVDVASLSDTEKAYRTSGGETVIADCHFVCIGKPLSSSWLHDTILKESLDGKGRVMVEMDLRVKGYNNIFAIGDITDIPEIKQGYNAHKHALLVAKNLKLLIKGLPSSELATYSTGYPLALVSLGRKEGLAQIPLLTLCGVLDRQDQIWGSFHRQDEEGDGPEWLTPVRRSLKMLVSWFPDDGFLQTKLVCCSYDHMALYLSDGVDAWNGDEQSVCYVHVYRDLFGPIKCCVY